MNDTSSGLLSPRQRKVAFWLVGLFLVYAVIGFLILPPIIRSVAAKQLSKQLDREVSIRQVKINPFALSTTIRGLLIKDKDGEPLLSWDEVYVNFQLSSFFGKPWVFSDISTTRPYVRVQMNPNRTFNFSDLIAKFSTNSPAAPPAAPSRPLALRIDRLTIKGASASFTDLTTRTPFKRIIGPLNVTLNNFRTDPDSKNPYSFAGTTDAGEMFSWSGYFSLDPLRSQGELTLNRITLNKYAPLYQDLAQFEIRGGQIGLSAHYQVEYSATNHTASVTNTAFVLRDFKLGKPGDSNNLVDLGLFGVTGVSVDLSSRRAVVDSALITGADLFVKRDHDNAINLVQIARPAENLTNAPGSILFLLRSVTNAVSLLLQSTNQWSATVRELTITNTALHLEDLANSRPATLDLDHIALTARHISNVPGTNLTANLSLRWNTNGTIHTSLGASFYPPTADLSLALTNLNLGTLDPYLESKLNLLILDSQLGLTGQVRLRTPTNGLPEVTFQGDARLDDLHTADGELGEDLLKWDSLRVAGIAANLNPPRVTIKQIAVDNAYARVVIETNHVINLLAALKPAEPAAVTETNPAITGAASRGTNEPPALPDISIGSIVLSNAAVRFTDRSVSPNMNLTIKQAGGSIDGISSKQLEHADLNLHALVDGVGPAAITGHINPFSGTQTNEIKVEVKNVDLTPASPYAGKFAGYRIARGKLNLDLAYELVGKKLESKNVITLDQFTFGEKVNSPEATHLPVRLAIAILKDREGKIVLDVPIEGSIDDPKFRIGKVVTRAVVNILEKVATSPFSLLGAAFGGGGEELSYQDFAPGSAELTPADKTKLDTLVKALYERPALQVAISGSVDPASDRDGLQRVALDKLLRTRKWMALGKSEHANTTPGQMTLTPAERANLVRMLFGEAQEAGKITPELMAANTNLAAAVNQIIARKHRFEKGATRLMAKETPAAKTASSTAAATPAERSKLAPPADPLEALLLLTIPVSNDDLQALATARAESVRAYLLQSGKVAASRLFLSESQTGGVRSDGSRAYLELE